MSPSVLVVFPPVGPAFRTVELGFVRLAGYLRQRGVDVRALDSNRDWFRAAMAGERSDPELAPLATRLFGGRDPQIEDQLALQEQLRSAALLPPSYWADAVSAWLDEGADAWEPWFSQNVEPVLESGRVTHIACSVLGTPQAMVALAWARLNARRPKPLSFVLGGPWCTTARDVLGGWPDVLSDVDAVAVFEGERSYARFVESTPAKRGGSPLILSGEPVPLRELPDAAFDLVDPQAYPRPRIPVLTRRRCPWSGCRFCAHVFPNDPRRADSLDAAAVVGAFARVVERHGIRQFDIADLATPLDALLEIARAVSAAELDVEYLALARAEPGLTAADASVLAAGGLRSLCIGLETSSSEALRRMRKGIELQTFERAAELLHGAGIEVGAFVLHYPGQTEDELGDTLRYLASLGGAVSVAVGHRFQLSRNSGVFRSPEGWPVAIAPGAERWLDVHHLPCTSDGLLSTERYAAVMRRAAPETLRVSLVDPC